MPTERLSDLNEARSFHARPMAAASRSSDARFERVFDGVPREAFVGPWQIFVSGRYFETPSADPRFLYQNVLVGLDPAKGINNGEPFLHAAWLGAAAPAPGETICHVGAGTGYYTALLSMLTLPGGRTHAFEIDAALARRAEENLRPFENVSVTAGDATQLPLPDCDLIYVNAGVVAPPVSWLDASRHGGRLILPWQVNERIGIALLITCSGASFAVRPLMPSWFVPCVGASDLGSRLRQPTSEEAWSVRSLHLSRDREPDSTAVAVYRDLWFSTANG